MPSAHKPSPGKTIWQMRSLQIVSDSNRFFLFNEQSQSCTPDKLTEASLGLWISVDQLFFCDGDIHSQSKYLHEL
jgi:hypothetical protein